MGASVSDRILAVQANGETEKSKFELFSSKIKISHLEQQCLILRKAVEAKQLDFNNLKTLYSTLLEKCARLEKSAQENEIYPLEVHENLNLEARQLEEAQLRLKEKEKALSELQEKCLQKVQLIHSHEENLRNYQIAMNRWRNHMKEVAQDMSQNIESLASTHPLRDYFSLTEFELTKIEIQLKKTPASAPERPELERCLAELVEQRNFLKELVDQTKAQLKQQADFLLQLSQFDALTSIPPPQPLDLKAFDD